MQQLTGGYFNQEAALALKKPTIAMSMTCSSKIIMQQQTGGSIQQKSALPLRDPLLQ